MILSMYVILIHMYIYMKTRRKHRIIWTSHLGINCKYILLYIIIKIVLKLKLLNFLPGIGKGGVRNLCEIISAQVNSLQSRVLLKNIRSQNLHSIAP